MLQDTALPSAWICACRWLFIVVISVVSTSRVVDEQDVLKPDEIPLAESFNVRNAESLLEQTRKASAAEESSLGPSTNGRVGVDYLGAVRRLVSAGEAKEPTASAADVQEWFGEYVRPFNHKQKAEFIAHMFQDNKVKRHGQVGINLKAFSEFLNVIHGNVKRPTADWVRPLFETLDTQKKGVLDWDEFLSMCGARGSVWEEQAVAIWSQLERERERAGASESEQVGARESASRSELERAGASGPDGPLALLVSEGSDENLNKRHKQMEDRWIFSDPFYTTKVEKWAFFAVYDGHAGDAASQWCHDRLHEELRNQLIALGEEKGTLSDADVKTACMTTFQKIDDELKKGISGSIGTTATVALIRESTKRLYVANVGDSAVLYINHRGEFSQVSKDHRPDDPEEAQLVKANGGLLFRHPRAPQNAPLRVFGTLAVTRALGDHELKPGVSGEPSFNVYDANDLAALVIASDGLWDYVDKALITKQVIEDQTSGVAQKLVDIAKKEFGSSDNICCLVAFYGPFNRTD